MGEQLTVGDIRRAIATLSDTSVVGLAVEVDAGGVDMAGAAPLISLESVAVRDGVLVFGVRQSYFEPGDDDDDTFNGLGYYRIGVYVSDANEEELAHPVGIWEGEAESRADARKKALDEYEDAQVSGWSTEILEAVPADRYDEEDLMKCTRCDKVVPWDGDCYAGMCPTCADETEPGDEGEDE